MINILLHDTGLQSGLGFAPVVTNALLANTPRRVCALQLGTLASGDAVL